MKSLLNTIHSPFVCCSELVLQVFDCFRDRMILKMRLNLLFSVSPRWPAISRLGYSSQCSESAWMCCQKQEGGEFLLVELRKWPEHIGNDYYLWDCSFHYSILSLWSVIWCYSTVVNISIDQAITNRFCTLRSHFGNWYWRDNILFSHVTCFNPILWIFGWIFSGEGGKHFKYNH